MKTFLTILLVSALLGVGTIVVYKGSKVGMRTLLAAFVQTLEEKLTFTARESSTARYAVKGEGGYREVTAFTGQDKFQREERKQSTEQEVESWGDKKFPPQPVVASAGGAWGETRYFGKATAPTVRRSCGR